MSIEIIALVSKITKEQSFSSGIVKECLFSAPLTAYIEWKSKMAKSLELSSKISLEED